MSLNSRSDDRIVPIASSDRTSFTVAVVDRDSMSSDLLANVLTRIRGCGAMAVQAPDLLSVLANTNVDVVVLAADLRIEKGSVFDLASAISVAWPHIHIVLLLSQATQEAVVSAFRASVRGVFSREQPTSEFLDCIEHVRKGFIWAGREEATFLLRAFKTIPSPDASSVSSVPGLTSRELQVVQCAARGKTNKAIASELSLSEHTVKNYLFRAFEKLGVSSRVELLFYLTTHGYTFSATHPNEIEMNYIAE